MAETDIRITGAENLTILGARLKKAAAGDLRRDLLRNIRAAAKPLIAEAREAARERGPKRGGLNERLASDPMSVRNRLTGAGAGIRIVTTTTDTRGANRGKIRHPVFGHQDRWVTQTYEPLKGWFDDTLAKGAPHMQAAVLEAMAEIALELTRRI